MVWLLLEDYVAGGSYHETECQRDQDCSLDIEGHSPLQKEDVLMRYKYISETDYNASHDIAEDDTQRYTKG